MNTQYTPGDIVLYQQGNKFMYAQVKEITANGDPRCEVEDGSEIQVQPALVRPVAINNLSLQDFGFVFVPRTSSLPNHQLTSCFALRSNLNLKLIPDSQHKYTIQLTSTGNTADVSNMSDIQHFLAEHLDITLFLSAIGNKMPEALTELQLIDTYSSYILSSDNQERQAGYNGFINLLPNCVYNVDICNYWIAEYHYENYLDTKAAASKADALKYYQAAYAHGGYDFLKQRIESLK